MNLQILFHRILHFFLQLSNNQWLITVKHYKIPSFPSQKREIPRIDTRPFPTPFLGYSPLPGRLSVVELCPVGSIHTLTRFTYAKYLISIGVPGQSAFDQ